MINVKPMEGKCVAAVFGIASVFALAEVFCVGLTNDTLFYIHYAAHLLRDGGLYDRWMMVNPPLILLFDALPVSLMLWLHSESAAILHGFAALLSLLSLLSTWHVLHAHRIDARRRGFWLAGAATALLVMPAMCDAFADREHFLFVLAMPWIIQMLLGLQPLPYTAALAGIGFCFKPYNFVLCLALLLTGGPQNRTFLQRLFSPSSWIIISVAAAYGWIVFRYFPGYFFTILPVAMTAYASNEAPLVYLFIFGAVSSLPAALLLLHHRPAGTTGGKVWYAFIASGSAMFILNGGWLYTQYLLVAPLTLLCFALVASVLPDHAVLLERQLLRNARLIAAILIASLLILSAFNIGRDIVWTQRTGYAFNYWRMPNGAYPWLRAHAGKRFVMLTNTLWATNIAPLDGPPYQAYAFEALWPLPWLYTHP